MSTSNLPKVIIGYSNGNLLRDIAALDGIAGICITVDSPGLIGVPKVVYSLADAITKGYTEADEPFAYRHLKEFYGEVTGNQELWIMGVPDTMTMAQMLDHTDDDAAVKLTRAAEAKIRLLGVMRKPDGGYDPGEAFMDSDVENAVLASANFAAAELADQRPLRILIEGRLVDEDSTDIFQPKTADIGVAGVVLGGTLNDGTASVGLVLGRAVKYGAEIKLGKVANGPLSITDCYIGTKKIKDVLALDTLHGKGYISFMTHPQKAGFYIGVDRMASTDDYRLLAYGRVVDKAAVITFATYVNELESEVDVVDGKISDLDIKHLEGVLDQQLKVAMASQVSSISVFIEPGQDIIATSKLQVKLRLVPKGYTTVIEVDLGLQAA